MVLRFCASFLNWSQWISRQNVESTACATGSSQTSVSQCSHWPNYLPLIVPLPAINWISSHDFFCYSSMTIVCTSISAPLAVGPQSPVRPCQPNLPAYQSCPHHIRSAFHRILTAIAITILTLRIYLNGRQTPATENDKSSIVPLLITFHFGNQLYVGFTQQQH